MSADDSNHNEEHYPNIPIAGKLFEKLSPMLDRWLCEKTYQTITHWLVLAAHLALLLAAITGLVLGIFGTSVLGYSEYLLLGIGYFILLPCVQYMSHKFIQSNLYLLKSTPSHISSNLFPNLLGIVAFFAGIIFAVYFVNSAITLAQYWQLPFAIIALFVGWSLATFARNLKLLYVDVKPQSSAGVEALGIFSVMIRLIYRIVPMLFSLFVLYGVVVMYADLYHNYSANNYQLFLEEFFNLIDGNGKFLLIYATPFPVYAYLAFSISYLFIELLRSILSVRKDK